MPMLPYMPPISPLIMPQEGFEKLMSHYGIMLTWRKSHSCPCVFGGTLVGSPDPQCVTCQGRGVYWDQPSDPFMGLLTWRHMSPTPDEFGASIHETAGLLQHGEPTLSIPYTADTTGTIWTQASLYDAFVEVDAEDRFMATLNVGGIQAVPYQQGLNIPAAGAVTVYDTLSHEVQVVSGYTVSGGAVTLPDSYPTGTAYAVEFTANPVFVALRKAGAMPMARPFGAGVVKLPRRFRIQTLDLWTRARQYPGDASPQGL